jgi:hypothetical protein
MKLRWHHGFLDPRDGEMDVEASREAVAIAIGQVMPGIAPVPPAHVSFVPCGDGRTTHVNVLGFGPFGVLER